MRRLAADDDALLLRERGTDDDLDALVGWTADHPAVVD